ncbi:hypothetical protein KR067_005162, partial [Drosophila pandora]
SDQVLPVVETTHGKVRGTLLNALYGEEFYGFDGIPYGEPPLGPLRFKDPRERKPWIGIRDCSQPQSKCIQVSSYTKQVEGSEDCLYLNISVKKLESKFPLPILVYIHGGQHKGGDSSRRAWGPDYFMKEDVMFISIGHRLGPFGFLTFANPSLEIPGNAGLKDIILALRWIKKNAKNFNGDPNRITILGHSSGAMIVNILLASPQTEGLFHKAILMAGYSMEVNRLPCAEFRLAKHLGYEGENIDSQVYEFLSTIDGQQLASTNIFTEMEKAQNYSMAFVPCVEPYSTPETVILAEPRELLRNSWSNRIPIILGTTSSDGLVHLIDLAKSPDQHLKLFQNYPERILTSTLKSHCDLKLQRELANSLLDYFCQAHCKDLTLENFDSLSDLFTHNIVHSQNRLIQSRLSYGQAPTYVYRFDFDSPDFNLYRIRFFGKDRRGASHVDELCYMFVIPATFKLDKLRPEYSTICRIVNMWVHFAATSNPNAPLTKDLVEWKPVSQGENRMLLNIGEELEFIPQPEFPNLEFYDSLFRKAGVPLF